MMQPVKKVVNQELICCKIILYTLCIVLHWVSPHVPKDNCLWHRYLLTKSMSPNFCGLTRPPTLPCNTIPTLPVQCILCVRIWEVDCSCACLRCWPPVSLARQSRRKSWTPYGRCFDQRWTRAWESHFLRRPASRRECWKRGDKWIFRRAVRHKLLSIQYLLSWRCEQLIFLLY